MDPCPLVMFLKCLSDKDRVHSKSPMNEKFQYRSSRQSLALQLHDSWRERKTWTFEKCFVPGEAEVRFALFKIKLILKIHPSHKMIHFLCQRLRSDSRADSILPLILLQRKNRCCRESFSVVLSREKQCPHKSYTALPCLKTK